MNKLFCSHCGNRFQNLDYPRKCNNCGITTYANPIPVAVAIIPIIEGGVLLIERSIPPHGLALPGGFMEIGHGWQGNLTREIFEETGIVINPMLVQVMSVKDFDPLFDTPNGNLLIFMTCPAIHKSLLDTFVPNEEVSALSIGDMNSELVFSAHQNALKVFLSK